MVDIEVEALCAARGRLDLIIIERTEHCAVALVVTVEDNVLALVVVIIIDIAAVIGEDRSRLSFLTVEIAVEVVTVVFRLDNNVVDVCTADLYPACCIGIFVNKRFHTVEQYERRGSSCNCGFLFGYCGDGRSGF